MLEVPDLGYEPTIGEIARRAAAQWPDKDFVITFDERMTFGQAEVASRRLAKRMLADGLGKGSRVGLYDTYSIEWVLVWLAAARIGALVMPFSSIYKPAELRTVLQIGDVHALYAPATILGKSVEGVLADALPALNDAKGGPLYLEHAPFLRSIYVWGGTDKAWATPI